MLVVGAGRALVGFVLSMLPLERETFFYCQFDFLRAIEFAALILPWAGLEVL